LKKRQSRFLDWVKIVSTDKSEWAAALEAAKSGPDILIATSLGAQYPVATIEGLLAVALTLRGAKVHFLLCDEVLPACSECGIDWYPSQKQFVRHGPGKDLCKSCFSFGIKMFKPLGLPVLRYSDFMTNDELQQIDDTSRKLPFRDIGSYRMDGMAVGEHAMAGALRYYARGDLQEESFAEPVLRRYFKASLITTSVMKRLFGRIRFECAVFHHGIYVPQGLIGEAARRENVKIVNWNPAYRKKTFIFSHSDTYHHTLMTEPTSKWENLRWTSAMEAELMAYLKSRWYATNDWIWFQKKPQEDLDSIVQELGVDLSKPSIGLLTNVMWDAQLHYPANAFPNMLDWILQTIKYFAGRPELQLIIRVHPAEITGKPRSRQLIVDEISKVFPKLPPNIFVVPPASRISTYILMMQCNAVTIYGTKTGTELASMGIPVIVAGEAWIRNKHITMDSSSPADYFKILGQLPVKKAQDDETTRRARMYAYHFFFRRMIPLEFMDVAPAWSFYKANVSSIRDLLPGSSKGLDVICDGILGNTDFIYPVEQFARARQ